MAGEPLVIVGTGGFGRETLEVVRAINDHRWSDRDARGDRWTVVGFLDDDPGRWGTVVDGVPVIGPPEALGEQVDARVVVCTGNPRDYTTRRALVDRLGLLPGSGCGGVAYATLVHPAAVVPRSCTLGEGTVALAGVVATTAVRVGAHVALMPQVVLTHDDHVADFVSVGSGVRLAGGVVVETGAYLGAGCLIREGVRVGAWSLIGMGAVVVDDVPPHQIWAGVPARFLRPVELPREVLSP